MKGRGYKTYNSRELKSKHREEVEAEADDEDEEEDPVPLVTDVSNFSSSIFPNVEVPINNQQL